MIKAQTPTIPPSDTMIGQFSMTQAIMALTPQRS